MDNNKMVGDETLTIRLSAMERELGALKRDRERLKSQLASMRQSRSWRVTAPLRGLMAMFSRLFRTSAAAAEERPTPAEARQAQSEALADQEIEWLRRARGASDDCEASAWMCAAPGENAISPPQERVHVRIYGHVQGVDFRNWFARCAKTHGLEVRAYNNKDGSVKAVFIGASTIIDTIIPRLRRGPKRARVDQIIISGSKSSEAKLVGKSSVQSLSDRIRWTTDTIDKFSKLMDESSDEADQFCDEVVQAYREQHSRQAWVMNRLIRIALNRGKKDTALRLAENLACEQLSANNLRSQSLAQARLGESFKSCIRTNWAIRRSCGELHPASLLTKKLNGADYARLLGIRTPTKFQADISHTKIKVAPGRVIKPCGSSQCKGVFQILKDGSIYDVRNQLFQSEDIMFEAIKNMVKSGTPDSWIVEEFIEGQKGNPPTDLKLYCFYGDIPLIVNIQRYPAHKLNFLNATGEKLACHPGYEGMEWEGSGFTPEEIESVRKISLSIPLPFMRIDFVRSKEGELVFSEFTHTPAQFENFENDFDRLLGKNFVDAESRLYGDLMAGASFSKWKEFAASRRINTSMDGGENVTKDACVSDHP
jgi:acylphosphatase